jgi:thymidylate kinase
LESTSYFIALEGIDGAGKTTLCREVVKRLQYPGVACCSGKEIARNPEFVEPIMTSLSALLWPKENTTFDHQLPVQYWIYLQATWYSLASEFVIQPRLREGRVVLVDGWCYKFWAKLLHRGFDRDHLATIFSHATVPDMVLLLEPSMEDVWERKTDFKPHELGLHHNYPELGKSSFIDYQSRILTHLRNLARDMGWVSVAIDGKAPVEHNAEKIAAEIRLRLEESAPQETRAQSASPSGPESS